MIDYKSECYLPKTEKQLVKHVDNLLERFGARSLEEIIKVGKAGRNKRTYNLSKTDYMILEYVYTLDFLTTEQLKDIFFPNHTHTGSWYHFDKLSRHGLIENEFYYTGRNERWVLWQLTRFGLEMLADYKGYNHWRELRKPRDIKPTQLEHDYQNNQIFVDLVYLGDGAILLRHPNIEVRPQRDLPSALLALRVFPRRPNTSGVGIPASVMNGG